MDNQKKNGLGGIRTPSNSQIKPKYLTSGDSRKTISTLSYSPRIYPHFLKAKVNVAFRGDIISEGCLL